LKTVILHVGRHKTGTSSLQSFFSENSEILTRYDILYPMSGRRGGAHHLLAETFSGAAVKNYSSGFSPLDFDVVKAIRREIDGAKEETVLVSSEAFQNVNPKTVQKIFSGYTLRIVMYLREQSVYLRSAYAQRIHATNTTLSLQEYCQKTFRGSSDYFDYVGRWKSIFGESLDVLVYEREQLINRSVVDDFVGRYLSKVSGVRGLKYPSPANPSLAEVYLYYKLLLNHFLPDGVSIGGLYQLLGRLSEEDGLTPFRLSERKVSQVKAAHKESNLKVARKFFNRDHLFGSSERPRVTAQDLPFPLDKEAVSNISMLLENELPDLKSITGGAQRFSQSAEVMRILEKLKSEFLQEYGFSDRAVDSTAKSGVLRLLRLGSVGFGVRGRK